MNISRGSLAVWRKTLYKDASAAADQEENKVGDGQRQCRLIQWARGPQASGGPKQPMR